MASAGGAHEDWDYLIPLLGTTCVTYGRPGLAGSDPLPADRVEEATRKTVHQTAAWPTARGRRPRALRAGQCSVGAWIADRFARLWRQDVAGLVNIDSTPITPLPLDRPRQVVDDAGGRGLQLSFQLCAGRRASLRARTRRLQVRPRKPDRHPRRLRFCVEQEHLAEPRTGGHRWRSDRT